MFTRLRFGSQEVIERFTASEADMIFSESRRSDSQYIQSPYLDRPNHRRFAECWKGSRRSYGSRYKSCRCRSFHSVCNLLSSSSALAVIKCRSGTQSDEYPPSSSRAEKNVHVPSALAYNLSAANMNQLEVNNPPRSKYQRSVRTALARVATNRLPRLPRVFQGQNSTLSEKLRFGSCGMEYGK